jgi:hypothetical protein
VVKVGGSGLCSLVYSDEDDREGMEYGEIKQNGIRESTGDCLLSVATAFMVILDVTSHPTVPKRTGLPLPGWESIGSTCQGCVT